VRSGYRQRAPASLTPAKRLKFKSARPDHQFHLLSVRDVPRMGTRPGCRWMDTARYAAF